MYRKRFSQNCFQEVKSRLQHFKFSVEKYLPRRRLRNYFHTHWKYYHYNFSSRLSPQQTPRYFCSGVGLAGTNFFAAGMEHHFMDLYITSLYGYLLHYIFDHMCVKGTQPSNQPAEVENKLRQQSWLPYPTWKTCFRLKSAGARKSSSEILDLYHVI